MVIDQKDIIREATVLFAKNGFAATTISDISVAVGLSPSAGGIYRHFKSKMEIFEAIFDNYFESLDSFLKVGNFDPATSLIENKRQMVQAFVQITFFYANSNKDLIKLYYKERALVCERHELKTAEYRAISIETFTSICNHMTDGKPDFDVEASAGILIDSINFRVCGFSQEFGLSDERFIACLTNMLCAQALIETPRSA